MKHIYKDGKLDITLDEEIDMKSCKVLRTVIDGYIMKYQPKEFTVDLSKVEFMDSSGIGLLIGRYKFTNMLGGKLEVANLTQNVRKIFEMSGILKLIPVTEI